MKNLYPQLLAVLSLFFFVEIGYSQNALVNSNYGSQIQNYLNLNKEKLNLLDTDINDLYVTDEYFSKKTKITHVYVNQRHQGIEIFNAVSSVAIKDDLVFYYADNFTNNISQKINTILPQINAQQAIEQAVSQLDLGNVSDLNLLETGDKEFLYSSGNVSQNNIPVKLVFTQIENENLRLAWDLSIHTLDNKNWWSVRIDAVTGEILNTYDWILTCNFGDSNHISHEHHVNNNSINNFELFKTNSLLVDGSQYNVFAIPTQSPIHGPRTLLSEPANVVASPFGWHDTNGAAGAEFTITRGNNVWAQEDRDGNDGTGFSPDGTGTLNFDFPLNIDQPPALYEDVSVTNLFYMNNIMHDVWYQYGFDERAGNFQENNYGNGGAGSDFVFADAQDGSGLNNAFFGTPPDGGNPGMTMFLWSASGIGTPLNVNTSSGSLPTGGYTASLPATGAGNNIPGPTSTPVTADLILVDDSSAAPTEACNAVTNDLTGKIAVIRRGNCNFTVKIQNAQNAGAVGVIIANHNNPTNDPNYVPYVNMSGSTTPALTIPSVFVNNPDGDLIINALLNGDTINATLVQSGPYQRDGDLDNSIVAHEFGHGISTRLAGGPSNSNCLNNGEQMGEGWSDWFALMLTMQTGDLAETGRGIAVYSIGQDVDGVGLRNAPYSTDFTINGFTYGDTNDTANVSQPHGIGFVWATILWDLTWAYVDKYGFDPDIYNGTGGNNKVMQIVLDGIKLMSCNGGFVRGRDGILAADIALTGGEDQCMIWEVFAARGVGVNASQGNAQPRNDQVEDFTLLPETDPSLANCTSLSIDEFNTNDYKVYPNPANNLLHVQTNKNFGNVTLTLTDINGRIVISKKVDLIGTVNLNISQLQSGLYILNIKGQNISSNNKIIKN